MRKSVALLVTLVVLLAGLLSGCAQTPATAVQIGDQRITETQVDDAAALIAPHLSPSAGPAKPNALVFLAARELSRQLAAKHTELALSDAQREAALAQLAPADVLERPGMRDLLTGVAEYGVIRQVAAQTPGGMPELVRDIPVTVNPRFGTWNAAEGLPIPDNNSVSRAWNPEQS